eukprot:gb/GECG01006518.1/.p1 GENE.gb/GECG01006518.1/~~gb/GECG01006518.1/.p1  ORF type:complete len:200 (+),score=26.79 gb/GECG01006518.1/:1-600(+)
MLNTPTSTLGYSEGKLILDVVRFPRVVNHGTLYRDPSFTLDPKELSNEMKTRQKQIHPDKLHQSSEEERDIATSISTALNQAYAVLADPCTRANHLLKTQYGRDVLSEDSSTNIDPSLLMMVMEYRETISGASKEEDLENVEKDVNQMIEENLSNLQGAFESHETDEAARLTVSLQYLRKIIKESSQRREELSTTANSS